MTKQNVMLHNPASELELPRMEKRLPEAALTLSQTAALLAVPNINDALGMRDRAVLELFYSTGLRRSELCRLEVPDFNAERRTLHVRKGKGKKDRMVPVGEQAIQWVEKYLALVRPRLCLDTRTQALFLTGYGGPFNADVLSRLVSKWMEQAGNKRQRQLPPVASHVRHPHARRRRGHPLHPAVARSRKARNDRDLYRGQHPPVAGSASPLPSLGTACRPRGKPIVFRA